MTIYIFEMEIGHILAVLPDECNRALISPLRTAIAVCVMTCIKAQVNVPAFQHSLDLIRIFDCRPGMGMEDHLNIKVLCKIVVHRLNGPVDVVPQLTVPMILLLHIRFIQCPIHHNHFVDLQM